MSFYRDSLVKHPKKRYWCTFCETWITGEHIYSVSNPDGDIVSFRYHVACDREVRANCSICRDDGGGCTFDPDECAKEAARSALSKCTCGRMPELFVTYEDACLKCWVSCLCEQHPKVTEPTLDALITSWNEMVFENVINKEI